MSIFDVIETIKKYDRLCEEVSRKTENFYRDLTEIYVESIKSIYTKYPGYVANIERGGPTYRFKLLSNEFSLKKNDGIALIIPDHVKEKQNSSDYIEEFVTERIDLIVNNPEKAKYLAGCISLTAKLDKCYITIMRIFVNQNEEIAYEYGVGWRHILQFFDKKDLESKIEQELFERPIRYFLLEKYAKWAPIEDIRFIDNPNYIKPIQIGFKPAP